MPGLADNLQEAVDEASADAATLHAIINGPASGPGSTVNTDAGAVDTMAKRAAAMQLSEDAAAASAATAATSASAAATSASASSTSATAAASTKATIDAAVAAGTFTGAGVRVAAPEAGIDALIVTQDGMVLQETAESDEGAAAPLLDSLSHIARTGGRGTRIEAVTAMQAGDSSHAWGGPAYDGALSLAAPLIDGSDLTVQVNWDKRATEWRDATIDSDGLVLTEDLVENVTLIFPTTGQSLSVGGVPSYTSAVVDADNIKMIGNTSLFLHPYFSQIFSESGLVGLRHDSSLNASGYGETHLAAMALTLLAKMADAGATIPGVYFTAGVGGYSLRDLGEDAAPYVPQSRVGGAWSNLMRLINYASQQLTDAGRVPAVMPLVLIHGEEDSGTKNVGMTAAEYAAGLSRMVELYSKDVARLQRWHPDAPGLPLLITQTRRHADYMWSSSTVKIMRRGLDAPMLGQWAAPFLDRRIVMCGPNYHLPLAGDGSHLSGAGYFRLGEQIGRQMFACLFGKGPLYFRPIAVIRQSLTVFDIVFQTPGGAALALDTNIADALDGNKGFAAFDNLTYGQLAIASVIIQATDTVRVTLSSGAATTVELWCDYALWGDTSSTSAQTTTGPRGSLRGNTGYTSLISDYGGPSTTDYDWCPAFRIPIPIYSGSARTVRLDGRL